MIIFLTTQVHCVVMVDFCSKYYQSAIYNLFTLFVHMLGILPNTNICRKCIDQFLRSAATTGANYSTVGENICQFKSCRSYECKNCRTRFAATIISIFADSYLPLRKWFIAIYISSYKKGTSSPELADFFDNNAYNINGVNHFDVSLAQTNNFRLTYKWLTAN